jgi:hypothetical protein
MTDLHNARAKLVTLKSEDIPLFFQSNKDSVEEQK